MPDTLAPQVPVLLEVLDAFGIAGDRRRRLRGRRRDRHPGDHASPAPVEVVSGDRDLFQLVDDDRGVRLLYCGRGVAKLEVCDDALVQARYGVPAARYADFAALRGDPSDGLPGVPGVGEKTAARLIDRYGDIDAMLAALDDPAPASPPDCAPSCRRPRLSGGRPDGRRGGARRAAAGD